MASVCFLVDRDNKNAEVEGFQKDKFLMRVLLVSDEIDSVGSVFEINNSDKESFLPSVLF